MKTSVLLLTLLLSTVCKHLLSMDTAIASGVGWPSNRLSFQPVEFFAASVCRGGVLNSQGTSVGVRVVQRQQQKTRRSGRAVGQISNPAKMDGLAALLTFC